MHTREQPLFVRERKVIMFRKYSRETSATVEVEPSMMTRRAPTLRGRPTLPTQGESAAVPFSFRNFPSGTTKDELWEAFSQFGRYPEIRHAYVRTTPVSPFDCPDGAY